MQRTMAVATPKQAEVGDIIEIDGHWTVCIQPGRVARWTPSEGVCCNAESKKPGVVVIEELQGTIKNNYSIQNLDNVWKVQPTDNIAVRVSQQNVSYFSCRHFAIAMRHGEGAYKQPKAQKGDLIAISRKGYQHWAVYVGHVDGHDHVVHLTTTLSGISSASPEPGIVREDMMDEVIRSDHWEVKNDLDNRDGYSPRPVEEIVSEARALAKANHAPGYSVSYNNCEHFATQMRYGKKISRQVPGAEQKQIFK